VKDKVKKVAFYEFKVKFEISGNYSDYTKFRKGLAELKKFIDIDVEKIMVLESKTKKGEVKVSTTLAAYRLPANESEKTIKFGG
jgi:Tfp pilus assembly protein PilO